MHKLRTAPRQRNPKGLTKARLLERLKAWHRVFKQAPISSTEYTRITSLDPLAQESDWPRAKQIFLFYPTVHEAWEDAGITPDYPKCEICQALIPVKRSDAKPRFCDEHRGQGMSQSIRSKGRAKYILTDEIRAEITELYRKRPTRTGKPILGAPIGNLKELAKKHDLPDWQLKKWACDMGLSRTKELPWSKAEIEILNKYSWMIPSNIAKKLSEQGFHRTPTGINLQLKRKDMRAESNYLSTTQVAKCFGVDSHAVARWIAEGWLPAIMKGTTRTAGQGGDVYLVHEVDVYHFIDSHRQDYDLRKVNQEWFLTMSLDFPKTNAELIASHQNDNQMNEEARQRILKTAHMRIIRRKTTGPYSQRKQPEKKIA